MPQNGGRRGHPRGRGFDSLIRHRTKQKGKIVKNIILGLALVVLLGCNETKTATTGSPATTNKPSTDANRTPVDNTGVNVRDRDPAAKTPIDQNENKPDVNLTADIRKRVVDTKMSVDAQNVKIITQDGHVTLRGPVKSDEERQRIEEIATEIAGAGKVTNELEVTRN